MIRKKTRKGIYMLYPVKWKESVARRSEFIELGVVLIALVVIERAIRYSADIVAHILRHGF